MVEWVLDAARQAGVARIIAVVGHRAELVRETLAGATDVDFVLQETQQGTGHAVMMCRDALAGHDGPVLVLAGDTPLLKPQSLSRLLEQLTQGAAAVIGTAVTEANQGLGRIIRTPAGEFTRIVEEKDATPEERAVTEVNTGCYAFQCRPLLKALDVLRPNNKQNEYYLTDCPSLIQATGQRVVATPAFDLIEAMGVNTRAQLADVTRALRQQAAQRWLNSGVTIVCPELTVIDPQAEIGPETIIQPFTSILGPVRVGAGCQIGPHVSLRGPWQIPDRSHVPPMSALGPEP